MILPQKIFVERLESTNHRAQELVQKGQMREDFWIRANDQFAGKGQGRNTWISQPDMNLTGSLAIFPKNLPAADQFSLSMVSVLGVVAFLNLFTEGITIKWPNDVYYHDQKIAGILIENSIMGDQIHNAVIGVGVNINQIAFSNDLPNPVSMRMITGLQYDLYEIEDIFLEAMCNQINLLENQSIETVRQSYFQQMYRYKDFAPYREPGGSWFNARNLGVESTGELILEDERGTIHRYGFREIEFVL